MKASEIITLKNYKEVANENEVTRIENVLPFLNVIQRFSPSYRISKNRFSMSQLNEKNQLFFNFLNAGNDTKWIQLKSLFHNQLKISPNQFPSRNDILICFFPEKLNQYSMTRYYKLLKKQLLKKGMVVELLQNDTQCAYNNSLYNELYSIDQVLVIRRIIAEDLTLCNIYEFDIFNRMFFLRYYLRHIDFFKGNGSTKYLYVANTQLSKLYIGVSFFLLVFILIIIVLMYLNHIV